MITVDGKYEVRIKMEAERQEDTPAFDVLQERVKQLRQNIEDELSPGIDGFLEVIEISCEVSEN